MKRRVTATHRPCLVAAALGGRPRLARVVLLLTVACLPAPTGDAFAQGVRTDLYVTNGTVKAVVEAGGVLYVGGHFTQVGPATGGAVPLDDSTGLPQALPKVVGTVQAVAPDGSGGWYLGGSFTQVGGQPRSNLAHVGANHVVTAWNPNPDGTIYSLAVLGGTVYVGGTFSSVGGQLRNRIAALNGTTGLATGWNPGADATVFALAVREGKVYAGGAFLSLGGQLRSRIGAVSTVTGLATGWNPGSDLTVRALALSANRLYAGGDFTSIGGQTRNRIAALDTLSGSAVAWNPDADAPVRALAVSGNRVYAGGDFTSIGGQPRACVAALNASTGAATAWNPAADNPVHSLAVSGGAVYAGGWFTSFGGQPRNFLAAADTATGTLTSWNPNANYAVFALAANGGTVYAGGLLSSVGGQARNRIAALDKTTGLPTAWNPDANSFVWTLAVRGNTVFAGGNFTSIGGETRNYLAAIDATTGLATSWNPDANGGVEAMALAGDTLYVAGDFSSVGGQSRLKIAELNATTGAVTAWNPGVSQDVFALAVDHDKVYAGGEFTLIGGQSRDRIAALERATGVVTSWNPGANGTVQALCVDGSTVYAGGSFTTAGGEPRNRIAALDATTGLATAWNPNADATVNALAVRGTTMYAGGLFTTIGGQPRSYLAALDPTGAATSWDPEASSSVNTLALGSTSVYAGGNFKGIGTEPQAFLAGLRELPVITHVTPDRAGGYGPVTVTLAGVGFQAGATAVLARDPAEIEGDPVTVAADGSTITATFDLAGAATGSWDVVVLHPDGQKAESFGAFTVEALAAPQLRVDVVGPALIRANRRMPYDLVIQNEGNVDADAVPLWITGIPVGAAVEFDFGVSYPTQEVGEPDWSQVPLTFPYAGGQYTAVVLPRLAPGTRTRRIYLTVPPGTPTFDLGAALAPPWRDRAVFEACMFQSGVIQQASCMGARLETMIDSLAAHPEREALAGAGVWAKVAWQCEGATTLPAAVAKSEQVMDSLSAVVVSGVAAGACRDALLPTWRDTMAVTVVFAVDPNDKLGPHGPIAREQAIPYSIRFENLESATGDAQQVVVVDALDMTKLDPATVSLDAITFGEVRLVPPPGLNSYTTEVDLRPKQPVLVRVSATVDRWAGVLTWVFTSIDPMTGQPPLLEGFLPPNTAPPEGEGSVMFTARPQAVADGSEIRNDAVISFDGVPQTTPEWVNTVDVAGPSSAVLPLGSPADSARFTVRWAGAGEDLRDYTVYVSEDGGPYRPWRQNTVATADTFASVPGGRQYAFYSVARDRNGNVEAAPGTPDAQTLSPVAVEGAGRTWEFALEGATPNPAVKGMRIGFTLANRERARLEVIDVTGRRIVRREVGSLGPGRHSLDLGTEVREPGLYFLRLAQGRRMLQARVVRLQ